MARYNEVVEFINTNHRNSSRYRIEEHDTLNWIKAKRKRMNADTLKNHGCVNSKSCLLCVKSIGE